MRGQEHELNEVAYRRMEETINNGYPYGHFVAFIGGQIVADADGFDELRRCSIKRAGITFRRLLSRQATSIRTPESNVQMQNAISALSGNGVTLDGIANSSNVYLGANGNWYTGLNQGGIDRR